MGVKIREKVKGSGVWWLFINHKGNRMSRQVGALKAATKVKEQIEARLKLGHDALPAEKKPDPVVPTVQEYYENKFLPLYVDSGGVLASSTSGSYKNTFKNQILPVFGGFQLNKVTRDRMKEFVAGLVRDELAKASIQTVLKQFHKFFNHVMESDELAGIVTKNPVSGLSQLYAQAKAKHEVIEPLTKDEVPSFMAAVLKHSPRYYALFLTGIHTGLRLGELAGLQNGDIDFRGKYILVQRSIDRVNRQVVPTKTKRIRRVDLSDELICALKAHMQEQREYWMRHPRKKPDGTMETTPPVWLFPNEDGGWINWANVADRHFHPCVAKAGLHRRRPYDLRHTFASLLLTAGAPIAYVSEQMGHANIQLTVKVYGHLQPGANRHWINNLPGATPAPNRLEAAN